MISVVIRTLNEARYLPEAIQAVHHQEGLNEPVEIVLVDSGSTDGTLAIAKKLGCRVTTISKEDFSFGRSLNRGCEAAQGEILVFISGHCVPSSTTWLKILIQPLKNGVAEYSYGRQMGTKDSRFSECRLFLKYFPELSKIPQVGFFCNNANAALLRKTWSQYKFDEELTGLEDMDLAKRLTIVGSKIAYCSDAGVYHHHHEKWATVMRRYEREAIALQKIMPEIHLNLIDVLRYLLSAIFMDFGAAIEEQRLMSTFKEVILFRLMQFWGSYRGNREHRKLSRKAKEIYFYPRHEGSEIGQKP